MKTVVTKHTTAPVGTADSQVLLNSAPSKPSLLHRPASITSSFHSDSIPVARRVPSRHLNVETLQKTLTSITDLADQINWELLPGELHHQKVIDLCQLVVNDVFMMLGNAYSHEGGTPAVVSDFMRTFYPEAVECKHIEATAKKTNAAVVQQSSKQLVTAQSKGKTAPKQSDTSSKVTKNPPPPSRKKSV